MDNPKRTAQSGAMLLTAPNGVPFPFTVVINDAWPVNSSNCTFEIKGHDPVDGFVKTGHYQLNGREHQDYLDLFEKLARDFGLHLPQNRKQKIRSTFTAPYHVVLKENLAPGMLYGYGDP